MSRRHWQVKHMDRATVHRVLAAAGRRWPVALLVLVVVLGVDVAFTATRQRTYLARAAMVVSPSATVDRGQLVYSVDSLGRGRIVGTFAEVLGSDVVQREVAARLNVPTAPPREAPIEVAQRDAVAMLAPIAPWLGLQSAPPGGPNQWLLVKSSVIADSAVIQVLVESPDPETSAAAANIAGEVGIEQMSNLYPVYALTFLSRAEPPTSPYRPDVLRNYALGLLVGLGLAVVVAYLFDLALQGRSERRRGPRAATIGDAVDAPAADRVPVHDGRPQHDLPDVASGVAFTSAGVQERVGLEARYLRNGPKAPTAGEVAPYARPATRDV
jgi:capsular polysaccharide biosynthesis protein